MGADALLVGDLYKSPPILVDASLENGQSKRIQVTPRLIPEGHLMLHAPNFMFVALRPDRNVLPRCPENGQDCGQGRLSRKRIRGEPFRFGPPATSRNRLRQAASCMSMLGDYETVQVLIPPAASPWRPRWELGNLPR